MKVEKFPPPEADKEAGTPCKYLCREGCSIYDRRPEPCRVFACVWLTSQTQFDGKHALPNSERPDRTGIVMQVNTKGTIIAHCKTPEAWRGDRAYKRLMHFNQQLVNDVTIEHGDGRVSVLEKTGEAKALRFIGLDPDSNERKYVRERQQS